LELKPEELHALLEQAKQQGVLIGREQVYAEMHQLLVAAGYINPATGTLATEQAPAQAATATPQAAPQQPAPAAAQPTSTPTSKANEDSHVSQLGMSAEINAGFTELGILTVRELLKRSRRSLKSLFSDKEINVIDAKLADLKLGKLAR